MLPRLQICSLLILCLAGVAIAQDRTPAAQPKRQTSPPDQPAAREDTDRPQARDPFAVDPNRPQARDPFAVDPNRAVNRRGGDDAGPRDPNLFPPRDGDPRPPRRDDPRQPMGPNFAPGRYPPGMTRWGGASLFGAESDDPEMRRLLDEDAALDGAALQKAQQIRQAQPDERDALKKELEKILNLHFDARQKRRELQLKQLDEELKRLRKAIDERNDSRKEIIDKRLSELIGEPRDLEF